MINLRVVGLFQNYPEILEKRGSTSYFTAEMYIKYGATLLIRSLQVMKPVDCETWTQNTYLRKPALSLPVNTYI